MFLIIKNSIVNSKEIVKVESIVNHSLTSDTLHYQLNIYHTTGAKSAFDFDDIDVFKEVETKLITSLKAI